MLTHKVRNRSQQLQGIGPLVSRISIGEKLADIAASNRAGQGISHRMSQHVGIGMAQKPLMMRDFYATQNQFAIRGEGVHIVTETHSHGHSR